MRKLTNKELSAINTSMGDFTSQFGYDIYSSVLLEVIFGELYGRSIHLLRESKQEEHQDTHNYEGNLPTYKIE